MRAGVQQAREGDRGGEQGPDSEQGDSHLSTHREREARAGPVGTCASAPVPTAEQLTVTSNLVASVLLGLGPVVAD